MIHKDSKCGALYPKKLRKIIKYIFRKQSFARGGFPYCSKLQTYIYTPTSTTLNFKGDINSSPQSRKWPFNYFILRTCHQDIRHYHQTYFIFQNITYSTSQLFSQKPLSLTLFFLFLPSSIITFFYIIFPLTSPLINMHYLLDTDYMIS